MSAPTLRTERLTLRPLTLADAPRVRELAGNPLVADTTLLLPHPYPEGAAESWIGTLPARPAVAPVLAVIAGGAGLVGVISLETREEHARAELGYWIGVPYWGQGYATEATRGLLAWAFANLGLNRVEGHHFTRNPASGAVMRKAGMHHEGRLRGHVRNRAGAFEDIELYARLRDDRA